MNHDNCIEMQNAMIYEHLYRNPRDTGRKLKVLKMFIRYLGGFLWVLCTFNLRVVSTKIVECKTNIFALLLCCLITSFHGRR